jgi:hypothetical protein
MPQHNAVSSRSNASNNESGTTLSEQEERQLKEKLQKMVADSSSFSGRGFGGPSNSPWVATKRMAINVVIFYILYTFLFNKSDVSQASVGAEETQNSGRGFWDFMLFLLCLVVVVSLICWCWYRVYLGLYRDHQELAELDEQLLEFLDKRPELRAKIPHRKPLKKYNDFWEWLFDDNYNNNTTASVNSSNIHPQSSTQTKLT